MKPVERSEVLGLAEYEQIREPFRRRVIELKRLRRVPLGPNMTVLFENHDTVLFQVQEMLRTERISREDAVVHEIDTYNELIPNAGELSATLFIEYPEVVERERMLVAMAGIEDKFYLEVASHRAPVRNETKGTLPDRTTAVHYVKFALPEAALAALKDGTSTVALAVEHPAYSARTELSPSIIAELRADLA